MKGKTRRKIRGFLGIPLAIVGVMFTIGGLVAASLQHLVSPTAASLQYFPVWVWLTIFWFIVLVILVLISWILLYIYSKALTPVIKYFKEISFGKPDENTIKETIDGILNTEKVKPFYVHAAPKSKEMETVYSRLKDIGFAMVSGGPGEGKSMVAYHTAYRFQKEDRYHVYALRVERLENKRGEKITDEILFQLDNLKGKRKLILVDDAHKLAIKQDINIILQQEAKEGHGRYIWVETEFYEEKQKGIQLDTYIRIDFQSFLGDSLKYLYQSQDSTLQKALEGRIEGLDDAIEGVRSGAIRDAWHFAFVASRGEERLSKEIDQLSPVESLVLFLISAHTVLSWESELSITDLLNKLDNLKFGWLTDALRTSSFRAAIRSLQEHKQERKAMIRVFDKSVSDRGYIASLHLNFARAVIRASLSKTSLIVDLLSSVGELLTSEYRKCAYFGLFHGEIGPYAASFDRKNKDWIISFVNNPLPDKLFGYSILLRAIRSIAKDIYDEIIGGLDIDGIAEKVSEVDVGQFQNLAHLLHAMGDRRDELIEKLDLAELARKATSAEIEQFPQIEALSVALGGNSEQLIEELVKQPDFSELAKRAGTAKVEQFEQLLNLLDALSEQKDLFIDQLAKDTKTLKGLAGTVSSASANNFQDTANLLYSMGSRKVNLTGLLNYESLAEKANEAGPDDIRGLTLFMARLDDDHRNKLIPRVDWASLCMKCPIDAGLLRALGGCLENLWRQAEMLSDKSGFDKVAQYLRSRDEDIMQKIENAYEQAKMHGPSYASLYAGVGKFLWNCNQVDHTLSLEIATKTMSELIECFWIAPINYHYIGQLINALYEIDPDLSESFLDNNKVRGRIQQSINEHDWSKEVEGLKHLIEAFYRSVPDLWRRMVNSNWIVVDLSSLDLDSIYRDVEEEKNAGTAYNIP